ncbi:MAG: CsbD family protein [Oligoflexia bacterium]|nr:CsbD family protein [Oligoflexia bacterium]
MNWLEIEGKWDQIKGKIKEKWGKFTDDDLNQYKGNREHFVGGLTDRYGFSKEEAQRHADEFGSSLRSEDYH